VSNHITRGTLPNPISMSPVVLFPPVYVHPSLLDPPTSISPEQNAGIQPSLYYNRAPTSRPTVRSPSLSSVRLTPSSGDPWPNRAEHGLGELSIECHFRWPIMGNNFGFFDGDDFVNFRSFRLKMRRNKSNSFHILFQCRILFF